MNIILLGAPGSGKGTFSKELIKKFNYHHIAPGDIFRANIKNNTELGKQISMIVNSGNLVSDELVASVVKDYLQKNKLTNNIIIDGFPRTIGQAKLLTNIFSELNIKLDAAIYLDVDVSVVMERLVNRRVCPNCGATYNIKTLKPKKAGICDVCDHHIIQRKDDQYDIINTRFQNYMKEITPMLTYYNDLNILHTWKNLDFSKMISNFEIMNERK